MWEAVAVRVGWDFSAVRAERDPVPWDYGAVVRNYLRPGTTALDVGTGGGEVFLRLATGLALGVGVDAEPGMARVARDRARSAPTPNTRFAVMATEALALPDGTFDTVLNRHSVVVVAEVVRVLRAGGVFVTQQVGDRNTQRVFDEFGWGSNGEWWRSEWRRSGASPQDVDTLAAAFEHVGCTLVRRSEYDVGYRFLDPESLLFWLRSVPLPEVVSPDVHYRQLAGLLAEHARTGSIVTNEHRWLLVVRKP